MSRLVGSVLLLVVVALASGRAATADGTPPQVVCDAEDEACVSEMHCGSSSVEVVEPPPAGGGHALRWTLVPSPAGRSSYVDLPVAAPPDLSKNRFLQFRIKMEGARPGELEVRVESQARAYVGERVRGAGSEWKTMSFEVDAMERDGKFDPAAVLGVSFLVFDSAAGSYLIDDVAFVASPPAPAASAGKAQPAAAKKTRDVVADFEQPESIDFVDTRGGTTAVAPAGGKEKGSILAWSAKSERKTSGMEIHGVPQDVREYRTLRFRIRADRAVTQTMSVRLESSIRDALDGEVTGIGPQWKAVELRLPEMDVMGNFDPRRVRDVGLILFEPTDAVIQIDDVELEPGPGGWRLTEPETLVRVFGEGRAKKVTRIPTKHFAVFTDSSAAQGKFPKALEAAYDFSRKTLGLPEMDETLPIYIFQNPTLYVDFCVRYAHWTKEGAELTAGHGSGRYFATYYQSPDAPTVVHELTHSLFHRTRGAMGGSWFQEGVAMYVEHAWQKQSAAEVFSANLRSGQFVHLAEFMSMERLVESKDAKGGAHTADRLYLQAGAFYEFLVRGPMASVAQDVIPLIARTPKKEEEQAEFVAKLFGRPLADIEKDWIEWGSNPPKAK